MAKRVDANQSEIVAALRELGAVVTDLHTVGKGCPDILVGWRGHVWLFEIKTATGKLTEAERRWSQEWTGGHCSVVRSVEDALQVLEDVV